VWIEGRSVMEHRLRAEAAFGRPLPVGVIIHHADGSTRPDAPLVICPDQGYHKLLHARMRVKALGGDPNKDRYCGQCGTLKPLKSFRLHASSLPKGGKCRDCDNARRSLNKWRRRRRLGRPTKRRGRSIAYLEHLGAAK
jgi:hypothetical protein